MRYWWTLPGIILLSSWSSPKVYRGDVCNHEQVNIVCREARKHLRSAAQSLMAVKSSKTMATPNTPLLNRDKLQPKPSCTDTNSGARVVWMNAFDKEVLYWLNVARLDPAGFFNRFVKKQLESDTTNSYLRSLQVNMYAMIPASALLPDKALYEAALCHARNSGAAGYVGHSRMNGPCLKIYRGECCSYGSEVPLDVVIQLLVDEGVPSLGHRLICLGTFSAVGIATAPHKRYGSNTVLDFR